MKPPAPLDVNLVELVAGLMLTHDALHPGEPLYLREALAAHGVEADHVEWLRVVAARAGASADAEALPLADRVVG